MITGTREGHNIVGLLSRFSAVEREKRLLTALAELGEANAFHLMRAAKLNAGTVYVLLARWTREGIVAHRQESDAEVAARPLHEGEQPPRRRLYRLAERTDS